MLRAQVVGITSGPGQEYSTKCNGVDTLLSFHAVCYQAIVSGACYWPIAS